MMMAYVDTNVIVAKYVPTDELSSRATAFLESSDRKIASPVSTIELAAVISRTWWFRIVAPSFGLGVVGCLLGV